MDENDVLEVPVPDWLKEELERGAKARGMTIQEMARRVLLSHVNQHLAGYIAPPGYNVADGDSLVVRVVNAILKDSIDVGADRIYIGGHDSAEYIFIAHRISGETIAVDKKLPIWLKGNIFQRLREMPAINPSPHRFDGKQSDSFDVLAEDRPYRVDLEYSKLGAGSETIVLAIIPLETTE